MARIRSIKPEVRISEKVNSWPIECRYFWVLLWGYCDDYGYGRDNPRLIVADSFPLDDTITAEQVTAWMDLLWESEVIERFAVGDSRYFRIVNWDEHQKISHPAKQVLPTIDAATEVFQRITESLPRIAEASEKTSPKQGAGSREQGRGAGNSSMSDSVESDFAAWWSEYPRKEGRKAALVAYRRAREATTADVLLRKLREYKLAKIGAEKALIKMGAGWLNDERWEDEFVVTASSSPAGSASHVASSIPSPPREDRTHYCVTHPDYPDESWLPCAACERERVAEFERSF